MMYLNTSGNHFVLWSTYEWPALQLNLFGIQGPFGFEKVRCTTKMENNNMQGCPQVILQVSEKVIFTVLYPVDKSCYERFGPAQDL